MGDARRSPIAKKILHLIGVGLKYAVSFPFFVKNQKQHNHNNSRPPKVALGVRTPWHAPNPLPLPSYTTAQVLIYIMISEKTTGPVEFFCVKRNTGQKIDAIVLRHAKFKVGPHGTPSHWYQCYRFPAFHFKISFVFKSFV